MTSFELFNSEMLFIVVTTLREAFFNALVLFNSFDDEE